MNRLCLHTLSAIALVICDLNARADDPAKRTESAPATQLQATRDIPRPLDLGSDQVLGYVAFPKVEATLQAAETLVQSFAPPGAVNAGDFKGEIGRLIGDPALANLDASKPVVAMIFKPADPAAPPPFGIFIPVRDATPYMATFSKFGLQAKSVGGAVLAAPTETALTTAESLVPAYRRIETSGIRSDARVHIHVARALGVYEGLMRTGLDNLLAQMSAIPVAPGAPARPRAGPAGLLKLEAHVLLALLAQLDEIQMDIDLKDGAIGGSAIFAAKAGAALADVFNAPPAGPSRALGLLSGPGFMTGAFEADAKATSRLTQQIMDALAKDGDLAKLLTPEVRAVFGDLASWMSNQGAFAARPAPGTPFVIESATAVADEAKALAFVEKSMAFVPMLNSLYEDMGLPLGVKISLDKNVRRHAGVDVHRYAIDFASDKGANVQIAPMTAFLKGQEIAFAKGWYLSSTDPKALDGMIDRALAGEPGAQAASQAAKRFGEGRNLYIDYDLIGLMKAMTEMMPPERAGRRQKAAFKRLAAGDPMVFALTLSGGRAQAHGQIPIAPFVRMSQAMMGAFRDDSDPAAEEQ